MSPPNAPDPIPWRSLRHYRKNVADISVAELADRAGLSKSYVEHLEAGRRNPRPQTVARLAAALGTTVEKLRADLVENPTAEAQLAELSQQVEVLAERIKQVTSALPGQRTKTAQEVA